MCCRKNRTNAYYAAPAAVTYTPATTPQALYNAHAVAFGPPARHGCCIGRRRRGSPITMIFQAIKARRDAKQRDQFMASDPGAMRNNRVSPEHTREFVDEEKVIGEEEQRKDSGGSFERSTTDDYSARGPPPSYKAGE